MPDNKKVVVSCGPIPARLDSVKFITNRFKGGLAFKTAHALMNQYNHGVTLVVWTHTDVPEYVAEHRNLSEIVRVNDVFEYCEWFEKHARDYEAFVMAAAVANLTPVNPYKGKFPSHKYEPGEEFDIKFMIAPRAIDIVKRYNPRACLIGYKLFDTDSDEELIDIARHTLADARANVIFANRPSSAKSEKLAVMSDDTVIRCGFDKHVELIDYAINQEYYHTTVAPLTEQESNDDNVRTAIAIVEMFEKTFPKYGTVAVPIEGRFGWFATTARGHAGRPVIVKWVNHELDEISASGKATLNAPALDQMLKHNLYRTNYIAVHRHFDDPIADARAGAEKVYEEQSYRFPGTRDEKAAVQYAMQHDYDCVLEPGHGYLKRLPVRGVEWQLYRDVFPEKYFGIPDAMQEVIDRYESKSLDTLEIGCNKHTTAKYAYDKYVQPESEGTTALSWEEAMTRHFDLIYIKNAINYLSFEELEIILKHADAFVANTFLTAPDVKTTPDEAAVAVKDRTRIHHILRLPDDSLMTHEFYIHTAHDYKRLGLSVTPYGKNSALVRKAGPLDD